VAGCSLQCRQSCRSPRAGSSAMKSLAAHLSEGDPAAWRAAFRVLELYYGKAQHRRDRHRSGRPVAQLREMSPAKPAVLLARVLDDHPHFVKLVPEHLRPLTFESLTTPSQRQDTLGLLTGTPRPERGRLARTDVRARGVGAGLDVEWVRGEGPRRTHVRTREDCRGTGGPPPRDIHRFGGRTARCAPALGR
jgi:hypothetical protein